MDGTSYTSSHMLVLHRSQVKISFFGDPTLRCSTPAALSCARWERSQAYAICGPFLFAHPATLLRIGAKEIYGHSLLF